MPSLNGLSEQGRITWTEREHGWVGMPEEILAALAMDGFQECTRELTTSPVGDGRAGGAWRGINPRMKSTAAVDWMIRPAVATATVFIEIDSQPITGPAPVVLAHHRGSVPADTARGQVARMDS